MMVRPIMMTGPRICVFSINVTDFRRAIFHTRGSLTQVVLGSTPNYRETLGVQPSCLPAMLVDSIGRNMPREHFDMIGISFAGQVTAGGVVKRGPNIWGPDVVDVPLAEMVKKQTHTETIVINDVTANTWQEKFYGQAKGLIKFRVTAVKEGLGSKEFRDGEVIVGKDGQDGEIGHLVVEPGSKLPCGCGGYGHLESFTSSNAAKRIAREMAVAQAELFRNSRLCALVEGQKDRITDKQIAAAANDGDPFTLALIEAICKPLAKTIGEIHKKDPVEKYLITGDFAFGIGQHYFNILKRQVEDNTPGLGKLIIPGTDNVDPGLIGAGAAILAKLQKS